MHLASLYFAVTEKSHDPIHHTMLAPEASFLKILGVNTPRSLLLTSCTNTVSEQVSQICLL
jgi:hypothetical protein